MTQRNHNENTMSIINLKNKHVSVNICKHIFFILLAAIVALAIPFYFTDLINRIVAYYTNQWYLSGTSRVFITLFITMISYKAAFYMIKLTPLKNSKIFNILCFVLTFLWSVFMGLIMMPD